MTVVEPKETVEGCDKSVSAKRSDSFTDAVLFVLLFYICSKLEDVLLTWSVVVFNLLQSGFWGLACQQSP